MVTGKTKDYIINKKNNQQKKDPQPKNDSSQENELPVAERYVVPTIKDTDFLKMYQMKNDCHDPSNQSARSVMQNMILPDIEAITRSPYLNRIPEVEADYDLYTQDLMNLSQITEETRD